MSVSTIAERRGCASWASIPGSACSSFSVMLMPSPSSAPATQRPSSRDHRRLSLRRDGGAVHLGPAVDVGLGALLGDGDQQAVVLERMPGVDALRRAALDHLVDG